MTLVRAVGGQGRHRRTPSRSTDGRRFTHVRLTIYPDGGVARFRVHGEPVPDPRFLTGTVDLAALENGGDVVDCSDRVLLLAAQHPAARPGPHHGRGLGERPPPRRRQRPRHGARSARPGGSSGSRSTRRTSSATRAGWASLRGIDARRQRPVDDPATGWSWCRGPGCSPTPGTCSGSPSRAPVTHVRLDVFPDGGLARLRVNGAVPPPDRAAGGVPLARPAAGAARGPGPGHRRRPVPGRGGGDGGGPAVERHRPAARGGRPAPARLTRETDGAGSAGDRASRSGRHARHRGRRSRPWHSPTRTASVMCAVTPPAEIRLTTTMQAPATAQGVPAWCRLLDAPRPGPRRGRAAGQRARNQRRPARHTPDQRAGGVRRQPRPAGVRHRR